MEENNEYCTNWGLKTSLHDFNCYSYEKQYIKHLSSASFPAGSNCVSTHPYKMENDLQNPKNVTLNPFKTCTFHQCIH